MDLKIFAQIILQIFVQFFGKTIFAQIFAEMFAKKIAQIFYGSYLNNSLWFKTDAPLSSNHDPTFVNAHCHYQCAICGLYLDERKWWGGRRSSQLSPTSEYHSQMRATCSWNRWKEKHLFFYGCAKMSLDWGRNITWTMHASLDSCAFEGSEKYSCQPDLMMGL